MKGESRILNQKYQIIHKLGEGTFAVTYRAKDISQSGQPHCVLKELQLTSEHAKNRFRQEADFLQRLEHPLIPRFWEYFEEDRKLYLVQDFIDGTALNETIGNGLTWDEELVIGLLTDVLEVLEYIHKKDPEEHTDTSARGIHRDIKPSNLIRRNSDKKIVVIDFGAVKEILDPSQGPNNSTIVIGTPAYMPPEQKNGHPCPNSDIYALGMTGIQALTGQHPWEFGSDGWGKMERRVSPKLKPILDKMVLEDWEKRYQSASQVLKDIERITQPSWWEIFQTRFYTSRWWKFAGLAVATGAIAIILGVITQPQSICASDLGPFISCGEKTLLPGRLYQKTKGAYDFQNGKYQEALRHFTEFWREEGRDPETLIYLNNSFLEATGKPAYTIAVAVPIAASTNTSVDKEADLARQILRGVAHAQTKVNSSLLDNSILIKYPELKLPGGLINDKELKVLIADDINNPGHAKERAEQLVKQKDILGVVGHYASDSTVAAISTYEDNKLVLISPTSTSNHLECQQQTRAFLNGKRIKECSDDDRWQYFFRTVPSNGADAEMLVEYAKKYLEQQPNKPKTALLFYNPNSPYSKSLKEQFENKFQSIGGKITSIDLTKESWELYTIIAEEIKKRKAEVLVLLPDGQTSPSFDKAIELITKNNQLNGSDFILASWTLYLERTINQLKEQGDLKDFEGKEFILSLPWHEDKYKDTNFYQESSSLWGKGINPRTALAYDATIALIEAIRQEPTREGVQKVLAADTFELEGATGTIKFEPNGNRNEIKGVLVKVELSEDKKRLEFVTAD